MARFLFLHCLISLSSTVVSLPAEQSITSTSTSPSTTSPAMSPSASPSCGAEGSMGEVEEFVNEVPKFCLRDFSINQAHVWSRNGVQYELIYTSHQGGFDTEPQCRAAFLNGFKSCRSSQPKIAKAGTIKGGKGEFSWKTTAAPAVPERSCQSPDHPIDKVHFTAAQAEEGYKQWSKICRTQFSPQSSAKDYVVTSCIFHYNPCANSSTSDRSVDIIFNVTQSVWKHQDEAFNMRFEELHDQFNRIIHGCDTDTVTRKWGGASIVNDETGTRDYSITGLVNREKKYGKTTEKTLVEYSDEHGATDEQCKSWTV